MFARSLVLLGAFAFSTPALASEKTWTLYGALGGGAALGGTSTAQPLVAGVHPGHDDDSMFTLQSGRGAVVGSLDVVWSVGDWIAVEALGDTGFVPHRTADSAGDYWNRLAIGARLEPRGADFRPWVGLRGVHIHLAPWEIWRDHPVAAWAGSSDVGLQHRSGLSLATGVSYPVPYTHNRLRAHAGAEIMWVPIGDGPRWFPLGSAGLGYAF